MSKPSFLQFMQERDQLDEAFNSAPYELTMGKKNAGDVFFTFIDEDEKEYRIQFYTPQGLGKNVRQVFIGQKRGSVYPDAIARFKNPMRVIASMIEATKQFLATPLGKTIDGYAVNFSKKALDRGMTLIPKIIRQSGLKQKLNVMDLTYAPVPDRGYVWLVRKGKDPAQVFDGPKMQGITWDDPDKVGDVPVQNNNLNPDEVTDAKWEALVSAMKKTRFGNSVKTVGNTAIGQVIIDGFKIIGGLIRGSESVALNFDAYDSNNKQINLPLSSRRFVDIDVNRPDAFKGVVDLAIDVIMEIVGRENLTTGAPAQTTAAELTTDRWRALVNAFYKVNDLRGVSSSTMASGSVVFGGKSAVVATINRGITKGSDPIVLTVKAVTELGPGGQTIGQPIVIRDIDITKPSKLTGVVQGAIDQLAPLAKSAPNPNAISSKDLRIPKNASVFGETENGMSITWTGFKFPDSGKYAGATLVTNFSYVYDRNKVIVTNLVVKNGRSIGESRPYEITLSKSSVQGVIDEISAKKEILARNLQMLNSDTYNPFKALLDVIDIDKYNVIRWRDYDLEDRRTTEIMLDILSHNNKVTQSQRDLDAQSNAPKTGTELATYAGSIRDNAPKGRDLDWQIYASRDGQTLNVDWDITFRRNTTEGAFREFKGQIDRANQYLQTVYQDAKSKGYNPTEPNLMTLARAQQSDEWAQENGESAYSEYEQSLGGNMQIKI